MSQVKRATEWKKLWRASGLRQGWIAAQMGDPQWLLSRWMNGRTPWPDGKLAEFLKLIGATADAK